MILRRVIRFAAALLLSVPIVLASAELPVHACAFPMLGDGSSSNPWQVSTTDHLTCLVPPTIFIRTGGVYFILTTDLDWTSVDPITQPNMVSFDGDGHTITIKNRSNFVGLFGNPTGITVSNLTIH